MIIAVDKNTVKAVNKNNEYVYLFDTETLEELEKTKLHCIHYQHCKFVDINLTDYDIDCIKKANINDKDWDKIEYTNYKIGIIVPNYNYEHTIEKCLNSIFNQTYQNFEVIFVDDMSTDDSVKIAEKTYFDRYLHFHDVFFASDPNKMKIVQLKQKRLNGGARNEAYLHLSDDVDYVWYVDSDDWLQNDNVLENINNKLQRYPDVLFVGMNQCKNGKETLAYIPKYKDKYEAIKGWSGSCGKVIKKSLATRQECLYNEGTLKEDRNQHCKVCIYMETFDILAKPVYVWNRDNTKSVTTIRDEIIWGTSTIRHYADTKQLYLQEKGKDPKIDKYLLERVNMCKKEMDEGKDRQW